VTHFDLGGGRRQELQENGQQVFGKCREMAETVTGELVNAPAFLWKPHRQSCFEDSAQANAMRSQTEDAAKAT
jgi:hypothetical protein